MPSHSTATRSKRKAGTQGSKTTPAPTSGKPRPDFPLGIHKGSGQWCKKARGRVYYFGKVADDPKGQLALEEYLRVKDDIEAGRLPRDKEALGISVADLCNQFLAHKEHLRDTGERSPRTWNTYYYTCENLVKVFGKTRLVTDVRPEDFRILRGKLANTRGPTALRNEIQRVRGVFKFAFDDGLIDVPVRFGQAFIKPGLDVVRRNREAQRAVNGDRMFEAEELRTLLDNATQPLKTMILLGANCGFGQSDLSALPIRAVDLKKGWVDFARVKTGIRRRVPLWPETVKAIREWIPLRPDAKSDEDSHLLFLTKYGKPWVKFNKTTGSPCDALGQEFNKLLHQLEMKRPGVSFYALRHGFETIGGDTGDQVAVDAIMGHVPSGMAAAYRERINDDRLKKVTQHVRGWLFGGKRR